MKVAIVVGSSSDLEHARQASDTLRIFELAHEIFILSAHRTPLEVMDFAKNAEKEFSVIIAMAGKAAHLPGVIASMTSLPVIGVPLSASISGIDSLFSIVQMPDGIPVATMGVDSAKNAALFAVEILSLNNSKLREKLKEYREDLRRGVLQKNEDLKRGEPQ
ncbi:5-(carboxyamino)imidazole ribonucleotide mutase [Pseudothermotoga lettingae]|jgi:5-(carboxyamino)imidazole ribonucleotide mutase|uniref:N5-carboxyaminoimidazole ribonucleotide mutase n=1 Tax=Pseudothermotoga lettingae (strain ATCC BAA-301 / DSM 14385 / NBRC 107922 / TMO) TaxID=416591 RepID=A8F8I7_PSELT|nr:5-(carboxyamino)imidazole ribonucleotide mutase [Pseudothermotoga lettingae]ABV34471.1 phosphoribosylaminoimidazole carboxylase, catalytic subunit [Pseudothermotoga lettingae TMO]GLI48582.1 5-(carboxyamino)imidazole ribonucleotide mutase [Pseudothermotoga lettingae TMO]